MPAPFPTPATSSESSLTKNVNIRGVPAEIWLNARKMALQSGLPFRDYCILCLQDGGLYPAAEFGYEPKPEVG
jgi:hypothetical protein